MWVDIFSDLDHIKVILPPIFYDVGLPLPCRLNHPLPTPAVGDRYLAILGQVVRPPVQGPAFELVGGENLISNQGLRSVGIGGEISDLHKFAAT